MFYYVRELYKDVIQVGYFVINQDGEVVESKFLKTAEELLEYQVKPTISHVQALKLAR